MARQEQACKVGASHSDTGRALLRLVCLLLLLSWSNERTKRCGVRIRGLGKSRSRAIQRTEWLAKRLSSAIDATAITNPASWNILMGYIRDNPDDVHFDRDPSHYNRYKYSICDATNRWEISAQSPGVN